VRWSSGGSIYAIGALKGTVFHIRCLRFGKLAASYERRDEEEIRAVTLSVADKPSKPEPIEPHKKAVAASLMREASPREPEEAE
jgi:hypothetical protein